MAESPDLNINATAFASGPSDYGLLPESIRIFWSDIGRFSGDWNQATPTEKEQHRRISGSLEKLSATLLQCSRLKDHYNELVNLASRNAIDTLPEGVFQGPTAGFSNSAGCADFEGMLLQSRAALDRLTYFLTSRYESPPSQRYGKLSTILADQPDSEETAKLLRIHSETASWIDGLLATMESSGQSFRDKIAHYEAASERMSSCFAFILLPEKRALIFDCELYGYGVFQTAKEVAVNLSFLVLNSLAVIRGIQSTDYREFEIQWENKSILFSDWVTGEGGEQFGPNHLMVATQMIPDGIIVSHRNVDPTIFEKAVKFQE